MNAVLKHTDHYEVPEITPMIIERKNMTIVGGCYSIARNCNGSANGCGAKLSNEETEINDMETELTTT